MSVPHLFACSSRRPQRRKTHFVGAGHICGRTKLELSVFWNMNGVFCVLTHGRPWMWGRLRTQLWSNEVRIECVLKHEWCFLCSKTWMEFSAFWTEVDPEFGAVCRADVLVHAVRAFEFRTGIAYASEGQLPWMGEGVWSTWDWAAVVNALLSSRTPVDQRLWMNARLTAWCECLSYYLLLWIIVNG